MTPWTIFYECDVFRLANYVVVCGYHFIQWGHHKFLKHFIES